MKSLLLEHDTVISDALHLQKILLNLLSNAVKYTQEGGEIILQITETLMDNNTIRLGFMVKDNGIGMSADFLKRIFQPFERAEDNRMSQITGTGLGLAITKNIVDLMGGNIRVDSRENGDLVSRWKSLLIFRHSRYRKVHLCQDTRLLSWMMTRMHVRVSV